MLLGVATVVDLGCNFIGGSALACDGVPHELDAPPPPDLPPENPVKAGGVGFVAGVAIDGASEGVGAERGWVSVGCARCSCGLGANDGR